MKILEKREVKIAIGLLGMGAVCYGLYRLYHSRPERGEPSAILSHIGDPNEEEQETFSFMDKVVEHTPYE